MPDGWTPGTWAERLRYLAGVCIHAGRAAELRAWAEQVESEADGDRGAWAKQ